MFYQTSLPEGVGAAGHETTSTSVYCSCVRNGLCGGCPGYHRGVRHIHATELQPAHKVDQLRTDCECSVCMIYFHKLVREIGNEKVSAYSSNFTHSLPLSLFLPVQSMAAWNSGCLSDAARIKVRSGEQKRSHNRRGTQSERYIL